MTLTPYFLLLDIHPVLLVSVLLLVSALLLQVLLVSALLQRVITLLILRGGAVGTHSVNALVKKGVCNRPLFIYENLQYKSNREYYTLTASDTDA